jgi:hypothetical protein
MYVVASTEVNESFPYGNFLDLDNQTLASNSTDVDALSCLYEHIHALVIKKIVYMIGKSISLCDLSRFYVDNKSIGMSTNT